MAVRDYVARYVADLAGYKLEPIIQDTERLETTTARTADDVARDWRKMGDAAETAGRDMGEKSTRGLSGIKGRFGEIGSEIGAEFTENIGEAFRGGDIKDTILETFTSLGPALGVAGIAVGAGAAIIKAIGDGIEQNSRELGEKVKAAYADALAVIDSQGQTRSLAEIIGDLDPETVNAIKTAGFTVAEFAKATQLAEQGDPARLKDITRALEQRATVVTTASNAFGAAQTDFNWAAAATQNLGASDSVLAQINKTNDAIRERARVTDELNRASLRTDLERLGKTAGIINKLAANQRYLTGER